MDDGSSCYLLDLFIQQKLEVEAGYRGFSVIRYIMYIQNTQTCTNQVRVLGIALR